MFYDQNKTIFLLQIYYSLQQIIVYLNKDYKEYLTSLETLKHSIQNSFDHLPEAVAFTIHHHAKQLLNQMWETDDFENKIHHELHLIKFMTTVHEDTRRHLEEGTSIDSLPEKTLRLIQNKPSF